MIQFLDKFFFCVIINLSINNKYVSSWQERGMRVYMVYKQVDKKQRNKTIALVTKTSLDLLFILGIIATITVPFSLKWLGNYLHGLKEHYIPSVAVYCILGVMSVLLLWELKKVFRTVLEENCFVMQNVSSLQRMSIFSFLIVIVSIIRSIFFLTIATPVIILVFLIAGLLCRVLAAVFEEAVRYKEENDLTI